MNGTPVVVDMGSMSYTRFTFSPQRYTIMAMRSIYHSTVTPAGMEQLPGREYSSAEETFDEATRTVTMQLKNAYPKEAGLLDLTRSVTLADGAVTLTDTVAFEKESPLDIHFLISELPTETPDGTLVLEEGVTLSAPSDLTCRIEEIAIAEDKNLYANWKREKLYMMHFETVTKGGTYTFRFEK